MQSAKVKSAYKQLFVVGSYNYAFKPATPNNVHAVTKVSVLGLGNVPVFVSSATQLRVISFAEIVNTFHFYAYSSPEQLVVNSNASVAALIVTYLHDVLLFARIIISKFTAIISVAGTPIKVKSDLGSHAPFKL